MNILNYVYINGLHYSEDAIGPPE